VTARLLHVSDLHSGRREAPEVPTALAALVSELRPELLLATGDLSHRGTREQLVRAREVLSEVGIPTLAVPGNHDIPYTFPARFTRPWALWEEVFGPIAVTHRSDRLVVVGLNSVRPWRHQSGRLAPAELERAAHELHDVPAGALRLVACHHHLAGSPWRAARKRPLADRDGALETLSAAGAEIVAGGHIHQASVAERKEFDVVDAAPASSTVVVTAPGLGRPRPHRHGEAQGLLLYEWDERELAIVTYIWHGAGFVATARRVFPRRRAASD